MRFSFFILISACSTTSQLAAPPSPHVSNSPSHKWWSQYKQARASVDDKESCRLFSQLSRENRFPLKEIAYSRAVIRCAKTGFELRPVRQSESWMNSLHIESKLRWSEIFAGPEIQRKFLMEATFDDKPQEEKTKLIEKALDLAANAEEKEEFLQRLYEIAPRRHPNPAPESYKEVAEDFAKVREFTKARKYFRKVIAGMSPIEEKLHAQDRLAKTWKLQRNENKYLSELRVLQTLAWKNVNRPGGYKYYHDISVRVARRHWTLGSPSQGRKVLNKLKKKISGKFPTNKIHWLLGRMEEEKHRYDLAIHHFDKAIESTTGDPSVYLWYRAWNLKKAGNLEEALTDFTSILNQDFDARAAYWQAKTLRELGRGSEADLAFENLTLLDPLGYYGLLSYYELGKSFPELDWSANETESSLPREKLNRLDWLVAVEETDLAKRYIEFLKEDEDLQGLELFQLYARAGTYLPLFIQIKKLPSDEQIQLLSKNPNLFFPTPFLNNVQKASEAIDVDEALIYAIMRQESAFDPRARSHADAFGLMQLLESIGRHHAKKARRSLASFYDLYDPETNILAGSSLIKTLLQRQKSFITAVASYNASSKAIRGWIKTRYRGDAIEFIEEVPYRETQQYIKLVMRNYIFYQRRKNRGTPMLFPEWCLKNIPLAKS